MVDWIKAHPYLVGGTLVGLLVLYLLMRKSGSGAAPGLNVYGPSEGLQAAALTTGAQLQGYAYAAQSESDRYAAAERVAALQEAGTTMRAYYEQQARLAEIEAARTVSQDQIAAALRLGLSQVTATPPTTGTPTVVYGPSQAVAAAAVQQQQQQAVINTGTWSLTPTGPAAYVVDGGGPGDDVHGVDTFNCTSLPFQDQWACAQRNQSAINASYSANSGSYLGNGIYAHTPEAWAVYGDPSISYETARARGLI